MSKRVTVDDMKAETNGKTSFIAIDDIGDLLRGQAARMGSLHHNKQCTPRRCYMFEEGLRGCRACNMDDLGRRYLLTLIAIYKMILFLMVLCRRLDNTSPDTFMSPVDVNLEENCLMNTSRDLLTSLLDMAYVGLI